MSCATSDLPGKRYVAIVRRMVRGSHISQAGAAIAMLAGTALLAAGCGGSAPRPSSAPAAPPASQTGVFRQGLAFAECMRTHGLPAFPEPTAEGGSVRETIKAGSGVDPSSPTFAAATRACRHLLPNKGLATPAPAISVADQADYLKAAACMRSRGVRNFPDPSFQGDSVTFRSTTPIDTGTPQYRRALTTCRKLIPAGLPDSAGG